MTQTNVKLVETSLGNNSIIQKLDIKNSLFIPFNEVKLVIVRFLVSFKFYYLDPSLDSDVFEGVEFLFFRFIMSATSFKCSKCKIFVSGNLMQLKGVCAKCRNELLWVKLKQVQEKSDVDMVRQNELLCMHIAQFKGGQPTESDSSSSSSSSEEGSDEEYVPSGEEVCLFSISYSVSLSDFKLSYELFISSLQLLFYFIIFFYILA